MIFLNYKIQLNLLKYEDKLNIEITDTNTNIVYVKTINSNDLVSIKPVEKFNNVFVKAVGKEPNYIANINLTTDNKLKLELEINYDDLYEIKESIILDNKNTIDSNFNSRLKELEDKMNKQLSIMQNAYEQRILELENKTKDLEKQIQHKSQIISLNLRILHDNQYNNIGFDTSCTFKICYHNRYEAIVLHDDFYGPCTFFVLDYNYIGPYLKVLKKIIIDKNASEHPITKNIISYCRNNNIKYIIED